MPSKFSRIQRTLVGATCVLLIAVSVRAETPEEVPPELEYLSPGVSLELVAEHPQVVTPTGIDVDESGRLWFVVCHTHFRPEDYDGPTHDEIITLDSSGSRKVFYNKTDATMDLELGEDGWVYLAERDRVLRVRDTDGDGVGDEEQNIAVLETEADYPHNGLSGMAWHPSGDLIFALGENFWKKWTLTAPTDGSSVNGSGEGGIFRCKSDGSEMRRIARGFWNPFGICVRADGTMFAGENDPGARPPCRLLHIVEGGDYGYQRRYGNAPIHPFVCWNGELPGTLPMMHSVGEAPCGIAPLGNGLVVGSWTDHRIDFYPLTAKGASFETKRISLVRGGLHFRPTCLVQASPTVFYLTDWVFGSYQLHKRGRVWKLEVDPAKANWLGELPLAPASAEAERAEKLRSSDPEFTDDDLFQWARSPDPFTARAAIDGLSKRVRKTRSFSADLSAPDRVTLLLALRKYRQNDESLAHVFLDDEDERVVVEALRWISDEELTNFLPDVDHMLSDPTISYRIFEACLATRNSLTGNAEKGVVDPAVLLKQIKDPNASPNTKAYALRLIDPDHKAFSKKLWVNLIPAKNEQIARELARTLAASEKEDAKIALLKVLADPEASAMSDPSILADVIAGLSGVASAKAVLIKASKNTDREVREEALRSLRFSELNQRQRKQIALVGSKYPKSKDLVDAVLDAESMKKGRPPASDIQAWRKRLAKIETPADLEAGRRLFHHRKVGLCSNCHRHSGRGKVVGPDLTALSAVDDHDRLLTSLLQPGRHVDPQYYARTIMTEGGDVFTGIMLRDGGGGNEFYRDSTGRERKFATKDIVMRKELKTSLMPDGLIDLMTDREIRDVLAFLGYRADATVLTAQPAGAKSFYGTWWLEFPDGYGGWLDVSETDDDQISASLLWRVGSARLVPEVKYVDGKLYLSRPHKKRPVNLVAQIDGTEITVSHVDPDPEAKHARGQRCPPMPPKPDLSKIKFGQPIDLFNGRDLSGWRLHPAKAKNGWSVKNGELVNETPKTDFSAYGEFGNLRSEKVFGDCRLHIEFNVDTQSNSGIYVRGLYEAQVVDRDSRMQGINGPGAVFGRIAPTKNAGLPGGQWQSYDITLVDRHITVYLNGQLVIDNQPIIGCTGGALMGNVTKDGPLYLQGDHTSVKYRNISIATRIN